jgi:hypothetical protein
MEKDIDFPRPRTVPCLYNPPQRSLQAQITMTIYLTTAPPSNYLHMLIHTFVYIFIFNERWYKLNTRFLYRPILTIFMSVFE